MLSVVALEGVPEVGPGADLADLVLQAAVTTDVALADGDVLTVSSKVVSKAAPVTERRLRSGPREESLAEETVRLVARVGGTSIVRHRLGVTQAAAGIDQSNVPEGAHLLLPVDPDRSARDLREALADRAGVNLAVVVTDTAGRAWRRGQTDFALGLAGLAPTEPMAGRVDGHGNPLRVTEPAIADEIAGAADLVAGKTAGRPFVVVRGLADRVLPAGEHGPGATALVRDPEEDLFGYGAREAVVAAVAGVAVEGPRPEGFGRASSEEEVRAALARAGLDLEHLDAVARAERASEGPDLLLAHLVASVHGWRLSQGPEGVLLTPASALP